MYSFRRPSIGGNRNAIWRVAWTIVSAAVFQHSLPLVPYGLKAAILRGFGARVGKGLVVKPRVTVKYPWFLTVGDDVWIGEAVWIDNHTDVRIGSNVCISQGAVLFTGNHDWSDPRFAFFAKPITVGDGVWITAFQRLGPGTTVPDGVAVIPSKRLRVEP
ncbi:MAG: putative colanic acid biosynthesis acetyltransferase [Devosia sp.]